MREVLKVQNLVIQRDDHTVLSVDTLSVYQGETLTIVGPNGAGKSTLLLAMACLIEQHRGEVIFNGVKVDRANELAYRRSIGLVLQDALLLDDTVYNNVAQGLRYRRCPKPELERRVKVWLEHLGIIHLANRRCHKLSGGEAQRVSLARALALEPEILLLDEPFNALDAPTHAGLQEDLRALLREVELTAVFITHDLDEALLLGDRVAVMLDGQVRQCGKPQHVFSAPGDEEIAEFVGVETVIDGNVVESSDGYLIVESHGIHLEAVGDLPQGRDVLMCFRPEDVTLLPRDTSPVSSARNRVGGIIKRMTPKGVLVRVEVDCGFPLVALITRTSAVEMNLEINVSVTCAFKVSAVHLIPR